jgi:hypothetical protein
MTADSDQDITTNINRSGGADLNTGRDITVGGDVTGRDKITQIINNFFQGDTAQRDLRNRRNMLERVKNDWVKGVLEKSLYHEVMLDLDLEEHPNEVQHPWDMTLQMPDRDTRALPPGTKIMQVFDEMNRALLILGEPGSGKTTMLLELARDTIARAEQDLIQPIPVVFNLSSWADPKQSIADWLVQELHDKYDVHKKITRSWIDSDDLLLLLDGLDEVKAERRETCVKAINDFRSVQLEAEMSSRSIVTTTATPQVTTAADLTRAGQVANAIAAQNVFTDYRSRRAANTIRRQTEDLALFAEMLNAVSLNAAANLDDLIAEDDLTTTPDAWRGVTWGLVKLFADWQLQRGFAIGTINVRLSTIKTYAKLAVKAGTLGTTEYALIRAVDGYRHSEGRHIDEARATTRRSTKKAEATTLTPEQAAQLKAPSSDTPQGRRDAVMLSLMATCPPIQTRRCCARLHNTARSRTTG